MSTEEGLPEALVALGFSHYEARAYVGLLTGGYGQTAYALWKVTGVPQPKIYEALRKLVERGVAIQVGTRPQRFAPRQVDEVLAQLRSDFDTRLDAAERTAAETLRRSGADDSYAEVLRGAHGKSAVLTNAAHLINEATDRLYLSAWDDDLAELADTIQDAEARGVRVILLAFGRTKIELERGTVYRHASTAHVLYRSHQNRHIAVICDGRRGLWGVGFDNEEWSCLQFEDRRLVGLLRQFVRHDIYVQKIYDELRPEMESTFGLGLEHLIELDRSDVGDAEANARQKVG